MIGALPKQAKALGLALTFALGLALAALFVSAPAAQARPGDYLVADSGESVVYRVNSRTGAVRVLADDPRLVTPGALVVGRNGLIYVADYDAFGGNGGIFSVNPRNGKVRVVSDDPAFDQPDGIAQAPNGDLFVTDFDAPDIDGGVFRVRLPSGATQLVSDAASIVDPVRVVVPPDGRPIVANHHDGLHRINPRTGAARRVVGPPEGYNYGGGIALSSGFSIYAIGQTEGIVAINAKARTFRERGPQIPHNSYAIAFDWFRGAVISSDGEDVFRARPGGSGGTVLDTNLDFIEGLAVEPPRCGGKTATIVGTPGPDRLNGSRFADVIVGLGGADVIRGKGGNDVICGGAGRDKLLGGAGRDRLDGGGGKDRCKGGAGRDRVRRC